MPEPVDSRFALVARFRSEYTTVQYDPTFHFPASVDYDQPNTADEEYRIRVSDFAVLDP